MTIVTVTIESDNLTKIDGELSCLSYEQVTKSIPDQPVKQWDYVIPGMGKSGKNCMKKVPKQVKLGGEQVKAVSLNCQMSQCSNCYSWWMQQFVYRMAFLIECFALFMGMRPAHNVVSVNAASVIGYTGSDIVNLLRKFNRRLDRLGVDAGLRIFHMFRIKKGVKHALRGGGYGKKGKGFWRGVREDALGFGNLYSYINAELHCHYITFPNWLDKNEDKEIVVKGIGLLETTKDVVSELFYLISHCAISTEKGNRPITLFGDLYTWNPYDHLTLDQIVEVQERVLGVMNEWNIEHGKSERYAVNDKNELIIVSNSDSDKEESESEEDNQDQWIDFTDFSYVNVRSGEHIKMFMDSIQKPEVLDFWQTVIHNYHWCISQKKKFFLENYGELPDWLKVIEIASNGLT